MYAHLRRVKKMKDRHQIALGSIIAYINIALNMVISVFLTPFLISGLGSSEYGVYKIIQSFSAQLSIMSFGISTLVARNVVFYNTRGEKEEKENFLFMANLIALVLAILVGVVGSLLYLAIDPLYAEQFTTEEMALAKQLFILFVVNVAVSILCDSFTGLMKAHEKFVISNFISTARLVLRLVSIILLINLGQGAMSIVLTDLTITGGILLLSIFYGWFVLKDRPKFHRFDGKMFRECLTFSSAILLQAIVTQANSNVDNIVLGSMKGTEVVTLYSCALSLYVSFSSLVTVFASMFGPRATRLVAEGADGTTLTDFTVKPARVQLMLAMLGISGFVLLGREFVYLWLGEGFEDVYPLTLILIIPLVIPLIESVTNTILDAKMKRIARSLILLIMCAFNIGITILLVSLIGYIGAAVGTALSLIIGDGLIMNIYLHKKIGLNIPRMFLEIFRGVLPASLLVMLVCIPLYFLPWGWLWFALKAFIIVAVYFVVMYFLGMNRREKDVCLGIFKKFLKTKKDKTIGGVD